MLNPLSGASFGADPPGPHDALGMNIRAMPRFRDGPAGCRNPARECLRHFNLC